MPSDIEPYSKITPALAIGLAAPHTWAASIMPVMLACAAAYATQGTLSMSMSLVLLIICIALQSAVNMLNDFFDFKKGTDTREDNLEPSDSVLVYNNIDPKHVLFMALALIAIAFIFGIYPIIHAGFMPLIIALIGACIVFLYSGGKTPLSYLPVGEVISGVTMGGLMCFACYLSLTKSADPIVFIWAIPMIIGIALIMQSNNTCDIEKDLAAGRKTLPAIIGRTRSCALYRMLVVIWIGFMIMNTLIWFTNGALVLPFMLLAIIPICKGLFANPLSPQSRIAAMNIICVANICFGAFYVAAILACQIVLTI